MPLICKWHDGIVCDSLLEACENQSGAGHGSYATGFYCSARSMAIFAFDCVDGRPWRFGFAVIRFSWTEIGLLFSLMVDNA